MTNNNETFSVGSIKIGCGECCNCTRQLQQERKEKLEKINVIEERILKVLFKDNEDNMMMMKNILKNCKDAREDVENEEYTQRPNNHCIDTGVYGINIYTCQHYE